MQCSRSLSSIMSLTCSDGSTHQFFQFSMVTSKITRLYVTVGNKTVGCMLCAISLVRFLCFMFNSNSGHIGNGEERDDRLAESQQTTANFDQLQ